MIYQFYSSLAVAKGDLLWKKKESQFLTGVTALSVIGTVLEISL